MRMLALDASTTAVGWAVFEDGEYVESGVYRPTGADWWNRVTCYRAWLYSRSCECQPDVIAYELATGRHGNGHTDRVLGAVEYVTRDFIEGYDLPFVTVTASQVKATGCHKHALDVAFQIKGNGLNPYNPGDEADAIGVGLAAWGKIKEAQWTSQS